MFTRQGHLPHRSFTLCRTRSRFCCVFCRQRHHQCRNQVIRASRLTTRGTFQRRGSSSVMTIRLLFIALLTVILGAGPPHPPSESEPRTQPRSLGEILSDPDYDTPESADETVTPPRTIEKSSWKQARADRYKAIAHRSAVATRSRWEAAAGARESRAAVDRLSHTYTGTIHTCACKMTCRR